MKRIRLLRYKLSNWAIDFAAWVRPMSCREIGEYHHVGDRWMEFKLKASPQEIEAQKAWR